MVDVTLVGRVALLCFASSLIGCDGLSSLTLTRSDGAGGSAADPVGAAQVTPGRAQLRLLGATEYRNTVRDLLGLEATEDLPEGERAGGYDTGASTRLDDNAHSVLTFEAERLGALFIAQRAAARFGCFAGAATDDECIQAMAQQLGRRAYRRPLSSHEQDGLLSQFQTVATETGDRVLAAETLVARLLLSPNFLYRPEIGTPLGDSPDALRTLGPYERASLISYAVTGSMPDDLLLQDAEDGVLEGVRSRAHVQRLLATPPGKARLVSFMKQWLRVTPLDRMAADPGAFPKLGGAEQGTALRDEFDAYVSSILFGGEGTLPALFDGRHTYVNRHTAPLYGLASDKDVLSKVQLDPLRRRGVLTLASTMAAHGSVADATKDRPVRRGLLVLNRLLCEEVGPPSGVNTAAAGSNVAEKYPDFESLTVREQFDAMMEQGPECSGCHRKFMPLGYTLGNYDGLGRFVTARNDRPINSAVHNVTVKGETKSINGALALVDALVARPETSSCFTRNFVTWTVGAASGAHVDELSSALHAPFVEGGQHIPALLEDALASPYLYLRRAE